MLKNFVAETTNAPGTAVTVNLAGALAGRLTWKGAGYTSGQQGFYFMEDGTQYETGIGTLTHGAPDTWTRTAVINNSLGTTARLNFSGTTRIYNEVPAERWLWKNAAGGIDIESRLVSALWWGGTSTGTGSAYSVTLPIAITAYAGGFELKFRAHTNCGANATLNVGLGAKLLVKPVSTSFVALAPGDIVAGQIVHAIYDPVTDTFFVIGGAVASQIPIGAWIIGGWPGLPAGCLWPDGRNVSRTTYAALFGAYGSTYGNGDGSTTFGLPDLRGRTVFGRDNMGGTAANRITAGGAGFDGTVLGAAGGSEWMQFHAHNISDPGHGHPVSDPGHAHPTQGYHTLTGTIFYGGTGGNMGSGSGTGGAGTGISIVASGTGISVQANGAGSSQNVPPGVIGNIVVYAGVA